MVLRARYFVKQSHFALVLLSSFGLQSIVVWFVLSFLPRTASSSYCFVIVSFHHIASISS